MMSIQVIILWQIMWTLIACFVFSFFVMLYAMDIMKLAILLLFMYKPVILYLFIF